MIESNQVSRKGRRLEQIVAALEKCWSPSLACVRSPDFLDDRTTGQKREVDVSIRYKIGTISILVILECRDRHTVQDVTWIEQLAKKRDDVMASRAVAVSSSGFTGPAARKAAHEGIEVRTVEELTPENVFHWVVGQVVVTDCMCKFSIKHVQTEFSSSDPDIVAAFNRAGGDLDFAGALLVSKATGERSSWDKVWLDRVDGFDRYKNLPSDGTPVQKTFSLLFESPEYQLVFGEKAADVSQITFYVELWQEVRERPASSGHIYKSEGDDVRIEAVEYHVHPVEELAGYVLRVQRSAAEEHGRLTVERRGTLISTTDLGNPATIRMEWRRIN